MEYFLATLFIIICILLIIVVLLQKGRGGGLGAAFGGSGSSAFGTKTGDVFTWVTIVLTALFLTLSVVTTMVYRPTPPMAPKFEAVPGAPNELKIPLIADGDEVYYTLDGTMPVKKKTKQSKLYNDRVKVIIPDGTIVKAIRYAGSIPSKTAQARYPLAVSASLPAPTSMPALESATKPVISVPASGAASKSTTLPEAG